MNTRSNTPGRGFLLVVLVAAAAATAGCLPSKGSSATPPQATMPGITIESPEVSPTPDLGLVQKTYPSTARAYAEAVVKAWKQGQINTLGDLTTPEVQEQLMEIPEPLNDDWVYLRCDGTAGSSYCMFTNDNGDELTLRISHQLLSKAHAAVEVKLDLTVYPLDGITYVKEFVGAWQIGNTTRMLKLSKQSVVDEVGSIPQHTPTYPKPDCCGGGLLQVKVNWKSSTSRFDVGTTLLGGPNAIVGYDYELWLKLR